MSTELGKFERGTEDISNRAAYEGVVLGTTGGLSVAAVEDGPAFESPAVHDIGLGVGIALCAAGLVRVLQHAYEHRKATPASRLCGWQK